MAEFFITDGRTLDGECIDVEIRDGLIDRIVPAGEGDSESYPADCQYDAGGNLITPPLIEPHHHLDLAGTAGEPRWNSSGTLAEGIDLWAEYKENLTFEDTVERATRTAEWYAANGVTRIRSHVDTTESSLTTVESLLDVKANVSDIVDVEIVAFPQDGILSAEANEDLLVEAIEMGADVIGAIPHNEQTSVDGEKSVKLVCDLAEQYSLPLDLHIDETDDPQSRFTEVLASEALKRGIGERTTASHSTAMHSYNDAYASTVISLLAESGVSVITNPPDNSVLQGAHDGYPRRRGHTRIDELHDAGVTVGIGHDSVMDTVYHYGVADPLDAAYVLIHYAHMAGHEDVSTIWEMLTTANAAVLGLDEYGLEEGNEGSLVVYDSPTPFDALRTRAPRTLVLNEGGPVARTDPATTQVERESGSTEIAFRY
ncbi:MAG: cytosine deaminase [Natronomonas sp.]|jgi:cytosine deaminase